jgi:hypothetical protein
MFVSCDGVVTNEEVVKTGVVTQGQGNEGAKEGATYLADIDQSAHQVLIAEGVDRILSLVPSLILNDTENQLSANVPPCPTRLAFLGNSVGGVKTHPHPYNSIGRPRPIRQPMSISNQKKPVTPAINLAHLTHPVRK